MEREIIKLDEDLAVDLCDGGKGEQYEFVRKSFAEHKRWSVVFEVIIKRLSDGKYFKTLYYYPATESQEQEPFGYDAPTFTEVFPIERLHTFFE